MKCIIQILLCSALLLSGRTSVADGHPLFEEDTILKAVVSAPLAQTYGQKRQEVRFYMPGQWSYIETEGETQRLDVSIRTRGDFRREFCNLPPLQLNFKKKQVNGTLFDGQDKLKLVAPCNHGSRYQQYVILEYLAYKTFEILTDFSYRTRLVRLTYLDGDEKLDAWTDLVFLIEDDADMARRLGLERLRMLEVDYDELDHPKTAIVQLFQFLIGNNDYSVIRGENDFCCHNMDILGLPDLDTGVVPIPFDFDMSGLVNAAYAAPPVQVPVVDVRHRYFYGLCQPAEILEAAIAHMQAKRAEIRALFANSEALDKRNKQKSLDYVDSFYEILDSPQLLEEEIIGRCRGRGHMERMLEAAQG
ncbi:MAG: hypothetical protein KJO82_03595 [Gammaproteobacteria bacterium]|nr:hypothetical protein [Gammaproteobacteria bacterium]